MYRERIKPKYESVTLFFGKALHAAFDYHYQNYDLDMTVEFFDSYFDGALKETEVMWQQNGARKDGGDFCDPETAKEYGKRCLRDYFEIYPNNFKVLESERDFEFELAGLRYTGIIDKIIEMDGKIYVLDYKTAAQRIDEDFLSFDPQISGYYLGAKALGYDIDGAIYDYIYKLKMPKFERYFVTRTEEQLKDFQENAKEALIALQSGAKYQNISRDCKSCFYQKYCFNNKQLGDLYIQEERIDL